MTTHAMNRNTRWKTKHILRIGSWNTTTLNNKDQEILEEIKENNIDICAIQETKKKGKGQKMYESYMLVYSGVTKEERAKAGVALLIHTKFKDHIESCQYISERIIHVKIGMDQQKLNVICVYSPENCKPTQERESFYEQLQTTLDNIPTDELLLLLGDFNARIGNEVVPGVKQRFNEETINSNGEIMINFCSFNELRINNTFFNHKEQYKYTFENYRGQKSMIDYVVTNRKIHPRQILDVRTLNSADVGSEHKLVLAKIRMKMKPKRELQKITEEKINIESLWNTSTRELYQNRLSEKIKSNFINKIEDLNESWDKIRNNIKCAAKEALGTRTSTINKTNSVNKTPWFRKEVKEKCKEKRKAYLKFQALRTPESQEQYRIIRNETKLLVRQTKNEHWEQFSKSLESDFYGTQKQIWRFMRQQRREISELTETNQISETEWEKYLTELFAGNRNIRIDDVPQIRDETQISHDDVANALKSLKNRKSHGQDGIPNELLKYGGECLITELTQLIQKIISTCKIPDRWRTSTMIPMFKKGNKQDPNNYRGINLLDTALKLTTKIITTKINQLTSLSDEQQGFRSGRSCVDAVFVLRQLTEKAIEYNKPAYLCFIDLQKAFDRIQLQNVIHLLYERNIPINLIQTIEDIYSDNQIQARINGKLTKPIPVDKGIRQGDSLSPLLFNIVMDEVIKKVRQGRGYRMGDEEIRILCYADDAVIIAENEDDLQRLMHTFNTTGKQYGMKISAEKTKCMTTSKEPLRCKIEVDGQVIKQELKFKYLGINITSYGDIEEEVREQIAKANKAAGCLNDTIWRNIYIRQDTKTKIYKATIRPIMTYTAETRPDTSKTRRLLETTEMKILRRIAGKTLLDRETSENIRRSCGVENVNGWVQKRKQEWNDHIDRMPRNRLVRVVRDKSPSGRRSIGRPRKRWCDGLNIGGNH